MELGLSLDTKLQVNVNFLIQSLIKTKSQSKNIWPRKQRYEKNILYSTEKKKKGRVWIGKIDVNVSFVGVSLNSLSMA